MKEMNIKEFADRVIELFPQISKGLMQREHNYLIKGDISLPQFWVLNHLYHNEKSKMNCLALHLKISPPATTGMIDRLIAQGMVLRKDDEQDRRIVWIELTSKGKSIIYNIRKEKVKTLIEVFGRISQKDREHYLNILEQIANIIDSPRDLKKQLKDKIQQSEKSL